MRVGGRWPADSWRSVQYDRERRTRVSGANLVEQSEPEWGRILLTGLLGTVGPASRMPAIKPRQTPRARRVARPPISKVRWRLYSSKKTFTLSVKGWNAQ